MSGLFAPAATTVMSKPCLNRVRSRQQSSQTASCSYFPAPTRLGSKRSDRTPKVAETDVAEPEEDEQDEQDEDFQDSLSPDLLSLLAPRTTPTPLLTPQEVGESATACACMVPSVFDPLTSVLRGDRSSKVCTMV